jgi:hypothetical protein
LRYWAGGIIVVYGMPWHRLLPISMLRCMSVYTMSCTYGEALQMLDRTGKLLFICATVIILGTAPAVAHHSYAMFDNEKTVVLAGTVKDFQWSNPHSWVQLLVPNAAGGADVEWSVEAGSPNGLERQGWSRHSAKPGDKAVIKIHPLKDGSTGGSLISMSINGEKVGKDRIGS